jgi:uncharacterized protein YecE (DUF72 family)
MSKTKIHIGTSGYIYNHWGGGVFYPHNLPQNKWLEYYCNHLDSVELNVSFYRLPSSAVFCGWHKRTPKNFRFAAKGSRYITHVKRLKDPKENLELFFNRAKELKEKLSVVLWQLAPQFGANIERLINFLKILKKTAPCRQAFEFRNESWFCDEVYEILDKFDVPLCIADWPNYSADAPDIGSFTYIRRHGTGGQLYGGCYNREQLSSDAKLIEKKKKDCYIYFNNDAEGFAVKNAIELKKIINTKRSNV